jgi:hypothetical protein
MARFLPDRLKSSKQKWRQKMRFFKNEQNDLSTCLEDVPFAETMLKRTGHSRIDSFTSQFPDSQGALSAGTRSKSRKQTIVESIFKLHPCATCSIRCRAVANPNSFFSRIHRWHKTWWPGWKIYQAERHVPGARATVNTRTIIGKDK